MGTPTFAVPTLLALHEAGHELRAAYTQPPRPAGRGKQLQDSPVHRAAEALGIAVCHPDTLRDMEAQANFLALEPEVAVVVAYGLMLPQPILAGPPRGCLNVHASLLPRWRGAAPIQRAILADDSITGVTIMRMEAGLDTGPMLLKGELPIDSKNAAQLTEELAILGAGMMVETLEKLPDLPAIAQPDEGVTYAPKITKAEARIDWTRPAREIVRQVQGLAPFPGAWFEYGGERIKLLEARVGDGAGAPGEVLDDSLAVACGDGSLRPLQVQRAGRGPMTPAELLRGFPIAAGTRLA